MYGLSSRLSIGDFIPYYLLMSNGKKLSLWNPAIHQSKESTVPVPPHRYCVSDYIGFGFDPASNNYKVVVLSVDKRKFSLWNPAIHKSKEFTLPPHSSGDNGYNVGLGFDGVSNNFKVVVFGADLMSAIVYCSGLDSWTDVSIPDNVFSNFGFEESRQIAIVDGCPYWSLSRYTYETRFLMSATLCAVKFDVETYLFSVTPEFYFDATQIGGGFEFGYQFVDIKDSLNLIVYNRYSTDCVVFMYTLDGEEGCGVWSKICILGPFQFDTQGWYLSMSQGFKYVGEILYHENGFFSCLDLETEEIKRLHGTNFTNYDISCFRYEPTLFYVQGMKSVHLTTQTRTHGGYKNPRRLISSLRDQSFS
ncbi:hypothetical protein AgCh_024364 [Apium graveolens]